MPHDQASYSTFKIPIDSGLPPRGFDKRDWLPPDWHELPWAVGRLLFGRKSSVKSVPQWNRSCRAWLTSAAIGRQWTQARLFGTKRGWTDTDRCQFCGLAAGTVAHRRKCTSTLPVGGWPKLTPVGHKHLDQMTATARNFLQCTGLGVIRVRTDRGDLQEDVRWHMELPSNVQH